MRNLGLTALRPLTISRRFHTTWYTDTMWNTDLILCSDANGQGSRLSWIEGVVLPVCAVQNAGAPVGEQRIWRPLLARGIAVPFIIGMLNCSLVMTTA